MEKRGDKRPFCVHDFCKENQTFVLSINTFEIIVFVEGQGITELVFRIYNRWGEKVFESHDQLLGWNGIYKGVLQEVDVYTYTVEATFVNGQTLPLKGNITLLR